MNAPDRFPTRVDIDAAGQRRLLAGADLAADTVVGRYEGPTLPGADLPDHAVGHAVPVAGGAWMLPFSDARWINHSCDPNCQVDAGLYVVTRRPVAAGEELTVSYDTRSLAETLASPAAPAWDPRRSFDCHCGARDCVGRVDRFRVRDYEPERPLVPPKKIRLGVSPGRGRGVFATATIRKGEFFERAPVLVSDGAEWELLEQTVFYHYCFLWGPEREHTAIGLGYASLYNHSYEPNADFELRHDELLMDFFALRDIAAGEEITIHYGTGPEDKDPLWFDVS